MEPSQACFDLIRASEGCRPAAYQDSVGVWTIGYGATGDGIGPGIVWTQEQADQRLRSDADSAAEHVLRLVYSPLTQGQLAALTDFVFNLGPGALEHSTLLKKIHAGDMVGVPWELYHENEDGSQGGWVRAGGKVLPSLVKRRKAEIELWNQETTA